MTLGSIRTIKKAEEDAAKLISTAQGESKQILQEAEKQAETLGKEQKSQIKKQIQKLQKQTESEIESELTTIKKENNKTILALQDKAAQKKQEAVTLIIKELLKGD